MDPKSKSPYTPNTEKTGRTSNGSPVPAPARDRPQAAFSASPDETTDYLAGVVGLNLSPVSSAPTLSSAPLASSAPTLSDAPAVEETAQNADEFLLMEYLDGELGSERRRNLEERLGAEPELRRKLAEFEQSWHVLDTLERTPCDQHLAETTLKSVIFSAEAEIAKHQAAPKKRRLLRWMVAGVLVLLGLLLGSETARFFVPDPNLFLLLDMPIVERFDKYRFFIDNQEALIRLTEEGVFETPENKENTPNTKNTENAKIGLAGFSEAEEAVPPSLEFSTAHPPHSELYRRFKRLKTFDAVRYNQFCRNHGLFVKLSESAQSKYRKLNERVARSADPAAVDRTLTAYAAWFRGLPTHEKYAISDWERSLSVEEFVATIKKHYEQTLQERRSVAGAEKSHYSDQELAEFLLLHISPAERERILSLNPSLGYTEIETAYRNSERVSE